MSAPPAVDPAPVTTWKRPLTGLIPAISSPRRVVDSGVMLAGLTITALPAANAGAMFHEAMGSGKFHGVMTPMTPIGSCKVRLIPSSKVMASPWTLSKAPA
ncbi:hypothetical protein D9M71_746280 [compost metagenome]